MKQFTCSLFTLIGAITLASCVGCSPEDTPEKVTPAEKNRTSAAADTGESIGTVTMLDNGTLLFDLREKPKKEELPGDQQFLILTSNEQYKEYFNHVAPIKPGESKRVMPWKKER